VIRRISSSADIASPHGLVSAIKRQGPARRSIARAPRPSNPPEHSHCRWFSSRSAVCFLSYHAENPTDGTKPAIDGIIACM
jgi:hypothetical protein